MNEQPRRGQPANAFEEYPFLNEAYLVARDNVKLVIGSWNRQNPINKVSNIDVPLMLFIHSCIPPEMKPQPFDDHSRNVRPRMQNIVYPLIRAKVLDQDDFAKNIMNCERAQLFIENWLANKAPRRANSGPQPRPKIKDYIVGGFIIADSPIYLRYKGKQYKGRITVSGKIEMDIGKGVELFKSPNAVLDKGFDALGVTASPLMFVVDETGQENCLQEIRQKYIEWKGL
jgi:hypothetical protein